MWQEVKYLNLQTTSLTLETPNEKKKTAECKAWTEFNVSWTAEARCSKSNMNDNSVPQCKTAFVGHHSSEVGKPLLGRIVAVFAQVPSHVCHHQQCLSVQSQTVSVKVCAAVVIGSHNVYSLRQDLWIQRNGFCVRTPHLAHLRSGAPCNWGRLDGV